MATATICEQLQKCKPGASTNFIESARNLPEPISNALAGANAWLIILSLNNVKDHTVSEKHASWTILTCTFITTATTLINAYAKHSNKKSLADRTEWILWLFNLFAASSYLVVLSVLDSVLDIKLNTTATNSTPIEDELIQNPLKQPTVFFSLMGAMTFFTLAYLVQKIMHKPTQKHSIIGANLAAPAHLLERLQNINLFIVLLSIKPVNAQTAAWLALTFSFLLNCMQLILPTTKGHPILKDFSPSDNIFAQFAKFCREGLGTAAAGATVLTADLFSDSNEAVKQSLQITTMVLIGLNIIFYIYDRLPGESYLNSPDQLTLSKHNFLVKFLLEATVFVREAWGIMCLVATIEIGQYWKNPKDHEDAWNNFEASLFHYTAFGLVLANTLTYITKRTQPQWVAKNQGLKTIINTLGGAIYWAKRLLGSNGLWGTIATMLTLNNNDDTKDQALHVLALIMPWVWAMDLCNPGLSRKTFKPIIGVQMQKPELPPKDYEDEDKDESDDDAKLLP